MSGGSYYGVVFDSFWTGPSGREIRRLGGRDGQVLALYLVSNRHTNMLGLYQLFVDDVRHETGLSFKALEKALAVLADRRVGFASYDSESAFVWVHQMARFRLGLQKGEGLAQRDGKAIAVNRLYEALAENPFLGPFFEINHKRLCLKKRRAGSGRVVGFNATHYIAGLEGGGGDPPSRGLGGGLGDSGGDQLSDNRYQRSGTRDQVPGSEKAPRLSSRPSGRNGTPDENRRVIRNLIGHVVKKAPPDTGFADLKEMAKQACADEKLEADAEVIGDALEQVLARHARQA